ncbi:Orotidine 5'-phosphate decarboxylase [Golovinomyces cichoracearum]|uniref:Orotidine 5'-phosphate decarboxylase n=1 Tax=Golovinomyces cichoracearum TaxID=62708 RepID=A0A420J7W2_9PEZI|nr:Orotidine 5'-phosphate decarboxylase [Golovinomyces cichoracearum]
MDQDSSEDTRKLSYAQRAARATHPLSSYLLRLMTIKKSNLCFSADVSSAKHLLSLANAIGPSIVVLKTHYDLVNDWDYDPTTGTGPRLAQIARRYGFLIFEDRKFADIGNTVQLQYVEGTARIIEWSHIVNLNMIPGRASVEALAAAAVRWKTIKHCEVKTDISVGNPPSKVDSPSESEDPENQPLAPGNMERKSSIVSITTVSQYFEPVNSRGNDDIGEQPFAGIEEAPLDRGLLILAQMSSSGNLVTKEYTDACVEAARDFKEFVIGFVSQEPLNRKLDDQFLSFTPGCQLPPLGQDENSELASDGKGQKYRTPDNLIGLLGNDIIIVGRGIIDAPEPTLEAERYRARGWEAYERRLS